jgi:hypothetical protein
VSKFAHDVSLECRERKHAARPKNDERSSPYSFMNLEKNGLERGCARLNCVVITSIKHACRVARLGM